MIFHFNYDSVYCKIYIAKKIDLYGTLSSLKINSPKAKIISLTPVKDTFEQWNLIENNPNRLFSGIALRNSAFVLSRGRYKKANDGATYCLSDGLKANLWDFVNSCEKISDLKKIIGFKGVCLLYNDDTDKELSDYIKTRRLFSYEMRKRMIDEGITFPVACDISSLDTLTEKHPVFATNLKNYKRQDLEKLSRYEGIIVAMGYEDELLGKTPSLTITVKETGLCSRIYNLKKSYEKITLTNNYTVDLSPYDDKGGLWTSPLKFTDEDREIFAKTALFLAEESEEVILPVNGVRSYIYKISQNVYRVYLYNDDDFFKVEKIKLPISIKHAKSLIKSENLKGFTSDEITVKLMNCKVEIVEIEEK